MRRVASDTYLGLTDTAFLTLKGAAKWSHFRRRLWERDGGLCGLCSQPVELERMHADHIIEMRDGGPTSWDNLRTTHGRCNQRRSAYTTHQRLRDRWTRFPTFCVPPPQLVRAALGPPPATGDAEA